LMSQVENIALSLANVSKAYGRVRALENLSFSVAAGRFFVLFGPSSVGKTTTLRTIAGLVPPDRGRVEIFGKDWTHEPIAGRGVSMVFQSFALYPHLTVYQNFAYPLVEEGVSRAEIDRRVKETAAMLKLDKKMDRKPSTLSGGEQQRVALARAFVTEPPLLFADEPTGSLDAATGDAVIRLMFDLNRERGSTLVLVTHDPAMAARCGRTLTIAAGRLVQ